METLECPEDRVSAVRQGSYADPLSIDLSEHTPGTQKPEPVFQRAKMIQPGGLEQPPGCWLNSYDERGGKALSGFLDQSEAQRAVLEFRKDHEALIPIRRFLSSPVPEAERKSSQVPDDTAILNRDGGRRKLAGH